MTVWNAPLASSSSVDTASLFRSSDFGRHDDQRLAEQADHLPAQQVEDLRRRGRLADLHVVLGAQLQEALEARRRVLRALPLVAVRQQQREAAARPHLVSPERDELIDDDLRAVDEVAELRLPDDQRVGVGGGVAVLEARAPPPRDSTESITVNCPWLSATFCSGT